MKWRRITTKPDDKSHMEIGGYLDGKRTYLWFRMDGKWIATLSRQKLYRLAKSIVRHFEADR